LIGGPPKPCRKIITRCKPASTPFADPGRATHSQTPTNKVLASALTEYDELRIHIERLRALLEKLVVRGLRACGEDELSQLRAFAEHLDETGAGHLASLLAELRGQIERDDRTSARTLLESQTNVRLLERLLTLRVVKGCYAAALAAAESTESTADADDDFDEVDDPDEDEEEE